uniref:SAP domain-containing protein n=1 Tax=Ditylenchus dipsaci TaxID=166011 RepID=A0A915DM30_9BILA
MSTRQRRSGADGGGLNKAMLHLLDVSRLRKELEQRGLDTKGSKVVLASRLEEAVWPEDFAASNAATPAAITRKAEQAVEETDEENAEPVITLAQPAKRMTRRSVKLEAEQPVHLNSDSISVCVATEAPVKALQKADPSLLTPKIESRAPVQVQPKPKSTQKAVIKETTPKTQDSTPKRTSSKEPSPQPLKITEPAPKPRDSTSQTTEPTLKAKESVTKPPKPTESSPKPANSTSKTADFASKPKEKFKEVSKTSKSKPSDEKVSSKPPKHVEGKEKVKVSTPLPSPQPTSTPNTHKKEVEKKKVERESSIEILETIQKIPKESKPKVKTIYSKPSISPAPLTSRPEVKSDTKHSKKMQSPAPLTIKTASSKPLSVDVTSPLTTPKPEQPSWNKAQASTTPSPSPGPRPIGLKKIAQPHNSSSTDSIEPSAHGSGLKKKSILVPPKKVAGGIDLLDNIIARQDVLLADKYKSEQEKALEKQRFELEKRKMSGAQSFGPLELARRLKRTVSGNTDP